MKLDIASHHQWEVLFINNHLLEGDIYYAAIRFRIGAKTGLFTFNQQITDVPLLHSSYWRLRWLAEAAASCHQYDRISFHFFLIVLFPQSSNKLRTLSDGQLFSRLAGLHCTENLHACWAWTHAANTAVCPTYHLPITPYLVVMLRVPYLQKIFFLLYVFMQLYIGQLLYRIKLQYKHYLFLPSFLPG